MWQRPGRFTALLTAGFMALFLTDCAMRQPESVEMRTAFNETEQRGYLLTCRIRAALTHARRPGILA